LGGLKKNKLAIKNTGESIREDSLRFNRKNFRRNVDMSGSMGIWGRPWAHSRQRGQSKKPGGANLYSNGGPAQKLRGKKKERANKKGPGRRDHPLEKKKIFEGMASVLEPRSLCKAGIQKSKPKKRPIKGTSIIGGVAISRTNERVQRARGILRSGKRKHRGGRA